MAYFLTVLDCRRCVSMLQTSRYALCGTHLICALILLLPRARIGGELDGGGMRCDAYAGAVEYVWVEVGGKKCI